MLRRLTCFTTLLLLATVVSADDWPGWRGLNRDGRSAETGLLQSWPEGGPKLVLEASGLGVGFSSVAVVGGVVYTLGDLEGGQHAIALGADGKVLWATRLGAAWADQFAGPRGTPTVDDGRVYAVTTNGELFCLDAKSGAVKWQKSLTKDFGGSVMQPRPGFDWRFGESPLVDGDRLVVTPGAKDAGLVALDKATGEVIWRTQLPDDLGPEGLDGAGYASAVLSEAGGVHQVVQLMGRGLVGVEAASGRFLWGYNRVANKVANIPTPLVSGDHVFAATGYPSGGAALVRLHRDGDAFRTEEVYFHGPDVLQNHHGQMVFDDGYVYLGHGLNRGFPVAVEMATGKFAWGPLRNAGKNSVAIAYADGRLYLRYQDGLVILVEATPEAYREHGSFRIPGVSLPSWSHPAISNGRLYLREQSRLYVYDVKAP